MKCHEPNFLTPHAFWNITDFGAKCEKSVTINTITLENGSSKNRCRFIALIKKGNIPTSKRDIRSLSNIKNALKILATEKKIIESSLV